MNKQFFIKHKYSILLIIFFLLMLPSTIGLPAQTDTRAIVTGVSIDKQENEFNVALQLITPQSNLSNNENIEIVEDKGDTFYECVNNLAIKLGKVVGFEHTNIIIIGDGVKGEDLMNIFDFLFRNSKITLSTIVLQSNNNAKKILETSAELNNNSSSSIQNNLSYNDEIIETSNVASVGNFFNDYFSFSKISIVPIIEEPEQDSGNTKTEGQGASNGATSGSSGDSGSSGGGSSGGGGNTATIEPLIKNNSESAVYKLGKFVTKLDKELTSGISLLSSRTNKGVLKVENVTDNKFYYDSKVALKVESSKSKITPIVKNNKLIYKVDINIYAYVGEIVDKNEKTHKIMATDANYLTQELQQKVKDKINERIQNTLNFSKTNNLDVFKFYDKFYKYKKNDLKKVLGIYGEDYLKACEIETNINIYPYK